MNALGLIKWMLKLKDGKSLQSFCVQLKQRLPEQHYAAIFNADEVIRAMQTEERSSAEDEEGVLSSCALPLQELLQHRISVLEAKSLPPQPSRGVCRPSPCLITHLCRLSCEDPTKLCLWGASVV